ncbi:MAG: toll/interleukin-1 receptor domain-containing protein [Terriglobales bacterium]
MILRDHILSNLSVPLGDPEMSRGFASMSVDETVQAFSHWWLKVQADFERSLPKTKQLQNLKQWLLFRRSSKESEIVAFRFLMQDELLGSPETICDLLEGEIKSDHVDLFVFALCADETLPEVKERVQACADSCRHRTNRLVMEPTWIATIVIESLKPLLWTKSEKPGASYFDQQAISGPFVIRRFSGETKMLMGEVVSDPGYFLTRFRELQNAPHYDGPIYMCTTFLPPVTHCIEAVARFYQSYGTAPQNLDAVREKSRWEQERWENHVRKHRRIDIIDRFVLEEYFAAPEYYQMPLSADELQSQLVQLKHLLTFDNYSLCLTPEAIDLCYELRGTEIRIRTDRRNKGQPRTGRISELILTDHRLAEVFSREFWTVFRATETEFKQKAHILEWCEERIKQYRGGVATKASVDKFDVFLCHNSIDKPEVKKIAHLLQEKGVSVWLDEWNSIPGRPWVVSLQEVVSSISAVAIFVGEKGNGPWQNVEMYAMLQQFVERNIPLIPVFLAKATDPQDMPIVLNVFTWVDFRKAEPDPLEQLVWGITRKRPGSQVHPK